MKAKRKRDDQSFALVDAEDQLAATRCGIDAFSQANKSDARGIEVFAQRQQILKASTLPVKSPHNGAIPVTEMFKTLVYFLDTSLSRLPLLLASEATIRCTELSLHSLSELSTLC